MYGVEVKNARRKDVDSAKLVIHVSASKNETSKCRMALAERPGVI